MHLRRRLGARHLFEQSGESELRENAAQRIAVGIAQRHSVGVHGEWHVGAQRHQLAADARVVDRLAQALRHLLGAAQIERRHLVEPGQQGLEVAEVIDQSGSRLGANSFYARNVVDRVAAQGEDVADLSRLDAELLAHRRGIDPPIAHGVPQPHSRADELHQVLVAGDDDAVEAVGIPGDQGGDDVVGLDSGLGDLADAKRVDHLVDERDLRPQLVRCGGAVCLVGIEEIGAEGLARRVEHDSQVRRLHLVEQLPEHRREAVHRLGRHAAGAVERRQRVKGAVDVRAAVDEVEQRSITRHREARKLPDEFSSSNARLDSLAGQHYRLIAFGGPLTMETRRRQRGIIGSGRRRSSLPAPVR